MQKKGKPFTGVHAKAGGAGLNAKSTDAGRPPITALYGKHHGNPYYDSAGPPDQSSLTFQGRNKLKPQRHAVTQGGQRPGRKSLKEQREEMHIRFYQTVSNQPFNSKQSASQNNRQSITTGAGTNAQVTFGSGMQLAGSQSFGLKSAS